MRRLVAGLAAMTAGVLALAAPSAATAARPRVLIVSLPTLTWEDIERYDLPSIERLLAASAVANLSVRTIGSRTSLEDGYATIGAGNRARGASDAEVGFAFDAGDELAEGRAADAYEARMGVEAGSASVLQLGYPSLYRANDSLAYGARLGAMAGTGVVTAVVANADPGMGADEVGEAYRPAVAAVMDRSGRVAHGTVGPALLERADRAPFGIRQSLERTTAAVQAAWDRADVVLVEASDLVRAHQWRRVASVKGWRQARTAALEQADRLVAAVVPLADPGLDLVLVVSPISGSVERLTVASARGPDWQGGTQLRSPSTRRAGYVTLPDVAPTVLEHLGVAAPDSMAGRPMSAAGRPAALIERAAELAGADRAARFRDRWLTPFLLTFVLLHAALSVVGIGALLRLDRRRAARWLGVPALVLLALPIATFLLGLLPAAEWGAPLAFLTLAAVATGLAAASCAAFSRVPLGPPMALAALTAAVLVVDVVTTERLQINTLFGYSPIVAGRFQGFGNQAFAVLVACTVLAGAWAVALRGATRSTLLGVALLFGAALVADGAPPFGSDVGGILAATPAYGTAFLLLSGRRVGWRKVLLLAGAALALLVVAASIDLLRPAEGRTHLGRVAHDLVDDPARVGLTIRRKVTANLSVLRKSSFSYLVPFLAAFLAALAYRPPGLMCRLTAAHPVLRPALAGTLVAATLGFLLNDSGVAVPGVMLSILNPVLLYSLVTAPGEEAAATPASPRASPT